MSHRLFVDAYKDGVKLTQGTDYSVKWSIFHNKITEAFLKCNNYASDNSTYLTVDEDNIPVNFSKKSCNFVKVEIKVINENSNLINAEQIIYAYYPIEFILINESEIRKILDISGGFAEVMYAFDGTNPIWDETSAFNFNLSEYFNIVW